MELDCLYPIWWEPDNVGYTHNLFALWIMSTIRFPCYIHSINTSLKSKYLKVTGSLTRKKISIFSIWTYKFNVIIFQLIPVTLQITNVDDNEYSIDVNNLCIQNNHFMFTFPIETSYCGLSSHFHSSYFLSINYVGTGTYIF